MKGRWLVIDSSLQALSDRSQVPGAGPLGEAGRRGERRKWPFIHIYMAGISEDFRPKSFGLEILSSQPKCNGLLPAVPALLCRYYKKVRNKAPEI